MFERILVLLENAQVEQELCQTALKLARETGARVQWVQFLHPKQPRDFAPLLFLHQQALLVYGIESDISQMAGELSQVIRSQLIQWGPDLLMISQKHFQDITPLFADQKNPSGREFACSVMIVPNPIAAVVSVNSTLPAPQPLPVHPEPTKVLLLV